MVLEGCNMILIQMYNNGFIIDGHAGYAEPGKDIVCAAVSAISQTCIMSIEDLTKDECICRQENGYMELKCKNPDVDTILLLRAFETGARAISENYKKFVRFVRFRCVNL